MCNWDPATGNGHWFAAPPAGRLGNSGVNVAEGLNFHTHNVAIVKDFKFTGQLNLDFMPLIGNTFNHSGFSFPADDNSPEDSEVMR